MVRKLLAILSLLIYIPAIAGVGFSTHYCFGEARETRVFSTAKQSCCCAETTGQESPDEHGCCSDDIKLVKLDNDHQSSNLRLTIKPLVLDLFSAFVQPLDIAALNPAPFIQAKGFSYTPLPPPPNKNILHCCYRI